MRAGSADGNTFTIKCDNIHLTTPSCAPLTFFLTRCVGVWDTVDALGMPQELCFSHDVRGLFGFPDKVLGPHIEQAFHAIGLHETRGDFVGYKSLTLKDLTPTARFLSCAIGCGKV